MTTIYPANNYGFQNNVLGEPDQAPRETGVGNNSTGKEISKAGYNSSALQIGSASDNVMAKNTGEAAKKIKALGAGAKTCGVIASIGRGILGLVLSPFVALKYIGTAVAQLFKGEYERALTALTLGVTAPIWSPVEDSVQTYRRYTAWASGGDGIARSDMHKIKGYAAQGVLHVKDGPYDNAPTSEEVKKAVFASVHKANVLDNAGAETAALKKPENGTGRA